MILTAAYLMLLCFMSLIAMLAMAVDKLKAKREARRISEKTLFTLALLGGGPGAWLGMYAFRHKTRHLSFVIGMPAIALIQLALAAWLIYSYGINI